MQVDAILFDLFDTLVLIEGGDSYYMPSLRNLYDSLYKNGVQIPFEDFLSTYFKVRDRLYEDSAENLEEPHFNLRISRALQEFGYKLDPSNPIVTDATRAFSAEFIKYVKPDKDALYVLKKLHGKYKLGLVSNLSISESASEILEAFGLSKYFDVILVSGAINKRKPSREIFEIALKALGVKPEGTLFVGDTPSLDVEGPKNVGLKAVLIKRKNASLQPEYSISFSYKIPKPKNAVKPDSTIENLKDLLEIIEDC
jgi:putative hydrolase of the HAD superfamily